jgi:signal transduction histidine kinase
LQRKLGLSDVLDLPSFTDVVKDFVDLYKVGVKVFDDKGDKIADVKIGNADFCGYVFSFPDGRSRCTATVARVKDGPIETTEGAHPPALPDAPKGMVSVHCFTGLRYLILPITWEGDVLGRIVFGPFTPEDLQGLPPSLLEISQGLDLKKASALMTKVRRAPEGIVAKVVVHFAQLLGTLIAAGQKTYLTSQMHIEATLDTNRELEVKNRELVEANQRLKELDRLKSAFVATVSHELRTPLTSIIGYSEMLAEGLAGPMNQEQVEYVRTIMDKGEQLLRLITSILDISQIEAGKVRLNFEPLDVAQIVASAVTSVRPQAQKKGLQIESFFPATPSHANADREKLRQIVVNLMSNAVKFTGQGGRVKVTVSQVGPQPELSREGYQVIVEDSGIGIPADQLEKVFETFYQVDSSSTREYGGAGLGLAIVRSFAHGHGGVVRVASQVGAGSRFTVVLPINPPTRAGAQAPPIIEFDDNRF